MKLTKAQKAAIRNWLNCEYPNHTCPFDGLDNGCLEVCPALFPKLVKIGINRIPCETWCPCQNYTLAYVRRIARRAIA